MWIVSDFFFIELWFGPAILMAAICRIKPEISFRNSRDDFRYIYVLHHEWVTTEHQKRTVNRIITGTTFKVVVTHSKM